MKAEHLLPVLFCAGLFVLLLLRQIRLNARQSLARIKQLYRERHDWRTVVPSNFAHLDLAAYADTRDALTALGCTWVADAQDVTEKAIGPDLRRFSRFMLSPDGLAIVQFYQVSPRDPLLRRQMIRLQGGTELCVTCDSAFTNGEFLCTHTIQSEGLLEHPAAIHDTCLPSTMSPSDVLKHHQQSVHDYLAGHPDVEAIVLGSMEEIVGALHTQQTLNAEYRESFGWLTEKEFKALTPYPRFVTQIIWSTIRAETRKEERRLANIQRDAS